MANEKNEGTTPRKGRAQAGAKQAGMAADTSGAGTSGTQPTKRGAGSAAAAAGGAAEGGAKKGGAAKSAGGAMKSAGAKKSAGSGGGAQAAAKKAPAKGGAGGGGRKSAGGGAAGGGAMQGALRQFVQSHPHGWGHDEWVDLVNRLGAEGHDIQDRDSVGMMLENERMRHHLEQVDGLGSKAMDALVSRYGTMWNLQRADAAELESVPGVSPDVARRLREGSR